MITFFRFFKYLHPFIREVFDHTKEDTRVTITRSIMILLFITAMFYVGYVYTDQRIDYLEKEALMAQDRVKTLEHVNTTLELKYEQLLRDYNGRAVTISALNKALEKCQSGREADAEVFRLKSLNQECKHTLTTPVKQPKVTKPPKQTTAPIIKKTPGRLDDLQ